MTMGMKYINPKPCFSWCKDLTCNFKGDLKAQMCGVDQQSALSLNLTHWLT